MPKRPNHPKTDPEYLRDAAELYDKIVEESDGRTEPAQHAGEAARRFRALANRMDANADAVDVTDAREAASELASRVRGVRWTEPLRLSKRDARALKRLLDWGTG